MAENKTQPKKSSAEEFVNNYDHPKRIADAQVILEIMNKITGEKPVMWGASLVGYGQYNYKSKSGREGLWFTVGFSARKTSLSLYLMKGLKMHENLLKKLGKHKPVLVVFI
ncbi:MAG: hypothetical protein ACJAZ3_001333 [Sphingobacteriales bacterium]|jgi:hypothetical protein